MTLRTDADRLAEIEGEHDKLRLAVARLEFDRAMQRERDLQSVVLWAAIAFGVALGWHLCKGVYSEGP